MGGPVFGLALPVPAADRFVEGTRILGISPLVIGLVIIGFGPSAPEMLVSAIAAWDGHSGLATGNAVGSNIINIALVLGVAALARPLSIRSSLLRRERPIPLITMLFALVLMLDGTLSRPDGMVLPTGFSVLAYGTLSLALRDRDQTEANQSVSRSQPV